MEMTHDHHCVHGLFYHLVLVIAYRRKVLTQPVMERLVEIVENLAPRFEITVLEANGETDHVHFLLKAKPHATLSRFVNSIKTVTSRRLKNEFPPIRRQLWRAKFWSGSYFIATTGGAPLEVIKRYVQSQGER